MPSNSRSVVPPSSKNINDVEALKGYVATLKSAAQKTELTSEELEEVGATLKNIGQLFYRQSDGLPYRYDIALRCFQEAARLGNQDAISSLETFSSKTLAEKLQPILRYIVIAAELYCYANDLTEAVLAFTSLSSVEFLLKLLEPYPNVYSPAAEAVTAYMIYSSPNSFAVLGTVSVTQFVSQQLKQPVINLLSRITNISSSDSELQGWGRTLSEIVGRITSSAAQHALTSYLYDVTTAPSVREAGKRLARKRRDTSVVKQEMEVVDQRYGELHYSKEEVEASLGGQGLEDFTRQYNTSAEGLYDELLKLRNKGHRAIDELKFSVLQLEKLMFEFCGAASRPGNDYGEPMELEISRAYDVIQENNLSEKVGTSVAVFTKRDEQGLLSELEEIEDAMIAFSSRQRALARSVAEISAESGRVTNSLGYSSDPLEVLDRASGLFGKNFNKLAGIVSEIGSVFFNITTAEAEYLSAVAKVEERVKLESSIGEMQEKYYELRGKRTELLEESGRCEREYVAAGNIARGAAHQKTSVSTSLMSTVESQVEKAPASPESATPDTNAYKKGNVQSILEALEPVYQCAAEQKSMQVAKPPITNSYARICQPGGADKLEEIPRSMCVIC